MPSTGTFVVVPEENEKSEPFSNRKQVRIFLVWWTEKKKNQPTHVLVDSNPAFEEPSMILLEQIFTIDKSCIERFMGYASKAEMLRIDMALLVSLALNVLSGNRSE